MTNFSDDLSRSYRVPYFDGLRGAGAFVVFLAHMAVSLYPSLTNGKPDASGVGALEYVARSPLDLITAANFAVFIFFVLSGHVMAAMAQRSDESFLAMCVRRYLRLALPSTASCIVSALLLMGGLYFNQAVADFADSVWLRQWFKFEPSLALAAQEGLIGIFRSPTSTYNSNLWTMYTELWGSLTIFSVHFLFRNPNLRIMIFAGLLFFFGNEHGFVSIISGALSFEIYRRMNATGSTLLERLHAPAIATTLVLLGLYFGSYPDFAPYDGGGPIYNWLPKGASMSAYWYHVAGAILVVHFIGKSDFFRGFFSKRLFLYLGKISFALYLIHLPLICSVGAGIIYLARSSAGYNVVALGTIAVLIVLCLALAELFYRLVDLPAIRFGKWLSKKIDRVFPVSPVTASR